jgi:hypothetical protein
MIATSSIQEIPNSRADLCAFRITGRVSRDDMAVMGERMLDAFEVHDEVDMLLVFDGYEGTDDDCSFSLPAAEAQLQSLFNVRRYVVAAAPAHAATMVEVVGKALPVEAKAFDTPRAAWAHLDARPLERRAA